MNRRPTTQDISWFLDLNTNKQLNLDPPYQRRSVWTRNDKQFFLDTIFRDYPSPAIFLHKEMNEKGVQIYNVVDGKQRINTILEFVTNKLSISKQYGDVELNGKKWNQLRGASDYRKRLWNYVLTVEILDVVEGVVVNEVFDRLNRNARKLDRQELRHAKFDGWLIKFAESEATKEEWKGLGVVTIARARRMHDVQFLSELLLVLLDRELAGFDQDRLDEKYAEYEEPSDSNEAFSEEDLVNELENCKKYLRKMEDANGCISQYAKGLGNFYTLWSAIALKDRPLNSASKIATKYSNFMKLVAEFSEADDPDAVLLLRRGPMKAAYIRAQRYFLATQGASTDLAQRETRYKALSAALSDMHR